jgi:hypothetical protein
MSAVNDKVSMKDVLEGNFFHDINGRCYRATGSDTHNHMVCNTKGEWVNYTGFRTLTSNAKLVALVWYKGQHQFWEIDSNTPASGAYSLQLMYRQHFGREVEVTLYRQ